MKTRGRNLIVALALLALSTFNPQLSTAFAQGSLTPPPGAPAPTMKSLDQIEARTPISSATFTIMASGSYYLTTNLYCALGDDIQIDASDVILDLNGFALIGDVEGDGIRFGAEITNVVVCNGSISGWGNGVDPPGFFDNNIILERLTISDCSDGIVFHSPATVRNCFFMAIARWALHCLPADR